VEIEVEPTAPAGVRVITAQLFRVREGRHVAFADEPPPPTPEPVRRPAKVARMLALAHRLEAAITAGEFADRADVARHLGFTRARVTQLLDLTLLAPDIQEAVLEMEAVDGVEPVSERQLRAVVRLAGWGEQRAVFPRFDYGTARDAAIHVSSDGASTSRHQDAELRDGRDSVSVREQLMGSDAH
jgi:hypothetical protein